MSDDDDATQGSTLEHGSNYYKNRAKKLKRNRFLQNAKGYGRKGSFGHGSELTEEQYNYLVNILEAMSKEKDKEERQLMANNVLGQLEGKEIKNMSNQLGSRVLESLLAYTDEETFAKQMDTLAENFRVACCDKYASHVVQRMLYIALLRSVAPLQKVDDDAEQTAEPEEKKERLAKQPDGMKRAEQTVWPCYEYCMTESYTKEHRKMCHAFVERLSKFLLNNLEEFVWENSANYVVRQCLLNLSGLAEINVIDGGADTNKLIVPEEWQKLLIEFNMRFMAWPQFAGLPSVELTSVVLQCLLRSVAGIEDHFQFEQFCSKLHNEAFRTEKQLVKKEEDGDSDNVQQALQQDEGTMLPDVFQQYSSIRLLEVCIKHVSSGFLKERIFEDLFKGHLKQLSLSRESNFAVQKLIDCTTDKDMMEIVFSELEESIEDILRVGHTGVVFELAKGCARLGCQQGKFVKLFLEALHCSEVAPEKMLTAVLHLLPADVTPPKTPKIHLHGSLILQALLEFNKPIKFVSALLEIPNDHLATILSDPRGSFIANAFVSSRFVGEKSREKMVRHLEGQYAQLVLTAHGSRVIEKMYEAGNPAQREAIVRELADRCEQLNSKPWRVAINKRLLVDTYKRDPARWRVAIKSDTRVEKMFDKLVGGMKRKAS